MVLPDNTVVFAYLLVLPAVSFYDQLTFHILCEVSYHFCIALLSPHEQRKYDGEDNQHQDKTGKQNNQQC